MKQIKSTTACFHCHSTRYVFAPWLERMMMEREIRMREIPPDIFTEIPPELIYFCHCNERVTIFGKNRWGAACSDCDGTTWRFTETAGHHGYFRKKFCCVPWQAIAHLPCHYFERCFCGREPQSLEEKELFESILGLMDDAVLPSQ